MRISDWSSDVCSSDLTVDNDFGMTDAAVAYPRAELFERRRAADHRAAEAADFKPLRHDRAHEAGQVIGTGALAADAVVGDEAADRHARAILQQRQHRGGDIAADVLDKIGRAHV